MWQQSPILCRRGVPLVINPEETLSYTIAIGLAILIGLAATVVGLYFLYTLVGHGWFCVMVFFGALPSGAIVGLVAFGLLYPVIWLEQRLRSQ